MIALIAHLGVSLGRSSLRATLATGEVDDLFWRSESEVLVFEFFADVQILLDFATSLLVLCDIFSC